jgi:hypothetical protein
VLAESFRRGVDEFERASGNLVEGELLLAGSKRAVDHRGSLA